MADSSQAARTPACRARVGVASVVFVLLVLCDRVSKDVVLQVLHHTGAFFVELIPGLLRFEFVANTGAAFGLGQGMQAAFIALALAVVGVTIWRLVCATHLSWLEIVGLSLLCAGAVGNAWDRVTLGFVCDFISLYALNFPVFNIADIAITCGVGITLVGYMWFASVDETNDQKESS